MKQLLCCRRTGSFYSFFLNYLLISFSHCPWSMAVAYPEIFEFSTGGAYPGFLKVTAQVNDIALITSQSLLLSAHNELIDWLFLLYNPQLTMALLIRWWHPIIFIFFPPNSFSESIDHLLHCGQANLFLDDLKSTTPEPLISWIYIYMPPTTTQENPRPVYFS